MTNKAINQQDVTSVDSLKFLKNRLTNYLTIGGIVLGTTFGHFNTANADNIAMNGNTLALAGVNEADDILVATNSATAFELKLDDGDIVAAGITQANSGAMVMTISDDEAASSSFTVTGNVTAASAALNSN